jgi:hypothetical protein
VVTAHSKAVAGSWRGMARLGRGRPDGNAARLGRVRPQGVGVHAHGSWPSRAAAWPCRARGTGIPGPRHDAAAKGDGGCGSLGGTTGSCTRAARRPEGKGNPRVGYRRSIDSAGSRGEKER